MVRRKVEYRVFVKQFELKTGRRCMRSPDQKLRAGRR
jgi:hypothetical protein